MRHAPTLALLALLAGPALAAGAAQAAQSPIPSPGGLVRNPVDEVLPHRGLAVTGNGAFHPGGGAPAATAEPVVTVREGFFGRMEAGIAGIRAGAGGGLGGLALRARLLPETAVLPGLTAGGEDLAGEYRAVAASRTEWRDWRRHLDHLAVYAVAGKDVAGLARVTAGVGDSHFLRRGAVGAAHGGAFGGVEVGLGRAATAVAEYDGAHLNAGLRLALATPSLGGTILAMHGLIGGVDLADHGARRPLLAFRLDFALRPAPALLAAPIQPGVLPAR